MSEEEMDIQQVLNGLSVEEQVIIRPVLERDLEFQRREKQRLRLLRTSIDLSKSESTSNRSSVYSMPYSESQDSIASYNSNRSNSVSPSSPSFRSCARCSAKLGFILNSGAKCRKCELTVCDACRIYTTTAKKVWLCPLCFKERELQAASGEWVEGAEDVSRQLLGQMRKAVQERSKSGDHTTQRHHVRAPPISRRNMTLPSLGNMTLLSVPSESEAVAQNREGVTRRFWGGSPSPRSPSPRPVSAGSNIMVTCTTPTQQTRLVAELHPREVIGSPAPRSAPPVPYTRSMLPSPSVPSRNPTLGRLPTTEVAPPTPTTGDVVPPMARRHVFSSKSSNPANNNHHLRPIDTREGERRKSSSIIETREEEYFDARSCPGTTPSSPDQYRINTSIKAFSTGQVPHSSASRNSLATPKTPCYATSDPQLSAEHEHNAFNEWEPYRKEPTQRHRAGSQCSTGSYLSEQMASSDRLNVANNNEDRRRASSVISQPESKRAARMRKSASRDTDTISMSSSTAEHWDKHVSTASQISAAPRFMGEIELKLTYEVVTASLHVHVIRCRSLPHFGNHKPNPYVKIILLGGNADDSICRHKTSARKNAVDPEFDEMMRFPNLSKSSLAQSKLLVSVWHKDVVANNTPIGEVMLPLCQYAWQSPHSIWLCLEAKAVAGQSGPVPAAQQRRPAAAIAVSRAGPRARNRLSLGPGSPHRLAPRGRIPPATNTPSPRGKVILQHAASSEGKERKGESDGAIGNKWNWKAQFEEQNINDLHLRSLKLTIQQRIGRFGFRTVARIVLNDYLHRKGRSIMNPCSCPYCAPWFTFLQNSSQPLSVHLPFNLINI